MCVTVRLVKGCVAFYVGTSAIMYIEVRKEVKENTHQPVLTPAHEPLRPFLLHPAHRVKIRGLAKRVQGRILICCCYIHDGNVRAK